VPKTDNYTVSRPSIHSGLNAIDVALLDYIQSYLAETGQPPSLAEMCCHSCHSLESIKRTLNRLKYRDKIDWEDKIVRIKPIDVAICGKILSRGGVEWHQQSPDRPDLTSIWVGLRFGLKVGERNKLFNLFNGDIAIVDKITTVVVIRPGRIYLETCQGQIKLTYGRHLKNTPIAVLTGIWRELLS
jgi:hypothetical protein